MKVYEKAYGEDRIQVTQLRKSSELRLPLALRLPPGHTKCVDEAYEIALQGALTDEDGLAALELRSSETVEDEDGENALPQQLAEAEEEDLEVRVSVNQEMCQQDP